MKDRLNISMDEYKNRRQQIFNNMPNDSVAILFAGRELYRNGDTHYPFRQKSDFYYLSGFKEADAVMVLSKTQHSESYILFCQPSNQEIEIWTGPRVGIEGAKEHYLADEAYAISQVDQILPKYIENKKHIFYTLAESNNENKQVIQWVNSLKKKSRSGISKPDTWHDLLKLIHEQRLYKSPSEIAIMRNAADISAQTHKKLMQQCKAMHTELDLEGAFINASCQQGAQYQSYPCIVASGKNACILHYTDNRDVLSNNDLILVDAGCEYEYYASDITRTFPRNGRFTTEQKLLYQLVLDAQTKAIAALKPGLTWNMIQETLEAIILQGLIELNILPKEAKDCRSLYMHSSGHWIGLDVHDVGSYKKDGDWRKLESGMAFTIEPGIYIANNEANKHIDKRWLNIGIRIEDIILMTENGYEILSKHAPRTIEEIESVMA